MAIRKSQAIFTILIVGCLGSISLAQGTTSERPRKLAPGVLIQIRDVNIDDAAVDTTREFSELISVVNPPDWSPNFDPTTETLLEKAKKVGFQREVWSLDFGCKPLRLIRVGGKDVYYLIYYVRNNGEIRSPAKSGTTITISGKRKPIRFVPSFVLQAHDIRRTYRGQSRPDIVAMIASKERATRGVLHDSYSISQIDIPVSTATADRRVWGVATFEGVDPRADLISVFVGGLTNAYRWEPPADGKYDSALVEQDVVKSKTLQLNFWRAGDGIDLHDNEVHYGIPLYPNQPARQKKVLDIYKLEKPITHRWLYR